jgi:uncharacterized membrane protein YsdA (DUF1294 family)
VPKKSPYTFYTLLAVALAVVIGVALFILTDWGFFWIWLLTLSIVTFIAYGYDKAQAKGGGSRIPEIVLHGLALAGGFLGGWLGRVVFRHKTQKASFTVVLLISTAIYLALIYFLYIK